MGMGTAISIIILIFAIVAYRDGKKKESEKRREMYNNLNRKSVNEMDKWRR
jgi:hypothetical protein